MHLSIVSERDYGDGDIEVDVNIQNGGKGEVYTYRISDRALGLSKAMISRKRYGVALQVLTKHNITGDIEYV